MEYSFHEGIPDALELDFDAGIFYIQKHLHLQSSDGWHSFALVNKKSGTIDALIHYQVEGTVARSPYRSPFGSFVFSKNVPEKSLYEFVVFTEQKLQTEGVVTLYLKNPPSVYAGEQTLLLESVLLRSGYKIDKEELSSIIAISNNSFEDILHHSKKSRLKKCRDREFIFEQLPLVRLSEVYDFIRTCRKEKGYSLSMSLADLKRITESFQENFFLHVVYDNSQFVGASISIRVKKDVLYTFYYDHAQKYDQLSPIVFLCEGLYNFCIGKGFNHLDLGTSTVDGRVNSSLLNFKLSLGAQPSSKRTFVKKLN